ncbi:hypothetical protein [Lentzea terrae]|uniref:hypothetical protein n=1 Tax=Lentzea terrae TaxID=2200761 RepID=UPI000DD43788|nr:hypothetical protein [Lentzea terrae]
MTLDEYVRDFRAGGYEVTQVVESVCGGCGGRTFEVQVTEECAVRRRCVRCSTAEFLADSAEFWEDDGAEECACPCGGEEFAAVLGLSCRPDGEVRWVSVGLRCLGCGACGVHEDWKIDYSPTRHLLTRA